MRKIENLLIEITSEWVSHKLTNYVIISTIRLVPCLQSRHNLEEIINFAVKNKLKKEKQQFT